MKKLFVFFCFVMMMTFVVSCEGIGVNNQINGIVITSEENLRTIKEDETLQLYAEVMPTTFSQEVIWSSSNDDIATVNEDGLVFAIKAGKVKIIATLVEDTTIFQSFALIIEEKEPEVVLPTSVTVTSLNGETCKVGEYITLSATVMPKEATQKVEWSSSDDTVATVRRGQLEAFKEGTVTVTCRVEGYSDIYTTITITIEKQDDPVISKDWVNMEYSTHEYYLSAANGEPLKVMGVVTHVSPVKNNGVTYTVQNGTEGYYIYSQDSTLFPVELGKVYEVGGFKKYYNGLNELVDVEYFVELDIEAEYIVNELDGCNPTDLEEMKPYHSSIVSGKATMSSVSVDSKKAYNFYAIVNGYSTTFRVDPAYLTSAQFEQVNQLLTAAVVGSEFDFKGLMTAYGYGKASPQIMVINPSFLGFEALSQTELLKAAASSLTITSSIAFSVNEILLPTSIPGFSNVQVSWSSDSNLINTDTGEVLHDSENQAVILTALLELNGETYDKEFEVVVFASDNTEYDVVALFDCEDVEAPNSWGNSPSKSVYAEGVVNLGTPKYEWLLRNALIACATNDKYHDTLGIRAQSGTSEDLTGRIELLTSVDANVIEFDTCIYGNDATGLQIKIEYSFDEGNSWCSVEEIITVDSRELQTYRIKMPDGAKRVAIVIVENSGRRVNIDNIKLMK